MHHDQRGATSFGNGPDDYPISTVALLEALMAGLSCVRADGLHWPSDSEYTRCVLEALAAAGRHRHLASYPDCETGNPACLWDASWWLETERDLNLVFAAESEWQCGGKVKQDFEKLLVAKCFLKLFITDSKGRFENTRETILEPSLRRYLCHTKGELYVWIDVEGTLTGGRFRAFQYCPLACGPDRFAKFEPFGTDPFEYSFQLP